MAQSTRMISFEEKAEGLGSLNAELRTWGVRRGPRGIRWTREWPKLSRDRPSAGDELDVAEARYSAS